MPGRFDVRIDAKAGLVSDTAPASFAALTASSLTLTAPARLGGTAGVFYGRTAVASTALGVSAVCSTTAVRADSVIMFALQAQSPVGSASLLDVAFAVGTISAGGFFTLATVNSVAAVGSYTAMWQIANQSA